MMPWKWLRQKKSSSVLRSHSKGKTLIEQWPFQVVFPVHVFLPAAKTLKQRRFGLEQLHVCLPCIQPGFPIWTQKYRQQYLLLLPKRKVEHLSTTSGSCLSDGKPDEERPSPSLLGWRVCCRAVSWSKCKCGEQAASARPARRRPSLFGVWLPEKAGDTVWIRTSPWDRQATLSKMNNVQTNSFQCSYTRAMESKALHESSEGRK